MNSRLLQSKQQTYGVVWQFVQECHYRISCLPRQQCCQSISEIFFVNYHVSENSTSSGVSGLPMSGSFLSNTESAAISSVVSTKSNRAKFSRICSGCVLRGMTAIPFCPSSCARCCAGSRDWFQSD